MAETPIDNLKIVVSAEAGSTVAELTKIASAIKEIKYAQHDNFTGLKKLSENLFNLGTTIELIDAKKLENVANSLEKINAFSATTATNAALKKTIQNLAGVNAAMGEAASGVAGGETDANTNDSDSALDSIAESAEEAAESTNTLLEKLSNIPKKLTEIWSSLKRIAMYRILRTVLKEIGDASTTGFNNAYAFSTKYGTQFSASLDNVTTSLLYMKNALGTALSEVLISLEPVIVFLADGLAEIANRLAELFATLRGEATYNKAVKVFTRMNEEANKLVRTLMKFDEINKLNGNDDSGVSTDDMFEITEVSTTSAAKTELALTSIIGALLVIKSMGLLTKLTDISAVLGGSNGIVSMLQSVSGFLSTIAGIIAVGFELKVYGNGLDLLLEGDTLQDKILGAIATALGGIGALVTAGKVAGVPGIVITLGVELILAISKILLNDESREKINNAAEEIGDTLEDTSGKTFDFSNAAEQARNFAKSNDEYAEAQKNADGFGEKADNWFNLNSDWLYEITTGAKDLIDGAVSGVWNWITGANKDSAINSADSNLDSVGSAGGDLTVNVELDGETVATKTVNQIVANWRRNATMRALLGGDS